MITNLDESGKPIKQCQFCGEWKPLEEFNENREEMDGLSTVCRGCCEEVQQV